MGSGDATVGEAASLPGFAAQPRATADASRPPEIERKPAKVKRATVENVVVMWVAAYHSLPPSRIDPKKPQNLPKNC
jgi:hypothetical protein